MRVCFDTFGCRLNRAEALAQEAEFRANGWEVVKSHQEADLIVVRGCSVTARAQRDCEKHIAHLREKYPTKRLFVTGCLANTTKKFNPSVFKALPQASAASTSVETLENLPTARAYLKVQDGCGCACSFCVVPRFRGNPVSVAYEEVIDRASRFIEAGYREIVLTGCNLALYESNGRRFADLVRGVAGLDANCRVRVGSIEPGGDALDFVHVMHENANVCRYLHLPFQSGSASMLAAMRRPYTTQKMAEVVNEALRLMPNVAIGCDLMTGFPGETDLDFLATKMLFKRFPIARAHIFPFSERPGTSAATMPNQISREVRHERARELGRLADEARVTYAKRFVGHEIDIVVESETEISGWTGEYLWCAVNGYGSKSAKGHRRERMKARVASAKGHVLIGSLV